MTAPAAQPPILTRALLLVFVASFGAMVGFYLLLSVVPLYAESVGAGGVGAGLVTGALMATTVAGELAMAAILAVSVVRGLGFAICVVVGGALVAALAWLLTARHLRAVDVQGVIGVQARGPDLQVDGGGVAACPVGRGDLMPAGGVQEQQPALGSPRAPARHRFGQPDEDPDARPGPTDPHAGPDRRARTAEASTWLAMPAIAASVSGSVTAVPAGSRWTRA